MNTPCLKKITYLIFYNLKKMEAIIIIFGIQYPNIRGTRQNAERGGSAETAGRIAIGQF